MKCVVKEKGHEMARPTSQLDSANSALATWLLCDWERSLQASHYKYLFGGSPSIFHVLEKLRVGLQDQHVALVLETLFVGLHASIKGIKFRVSLEGASINCRGLGVAFTFCLLSLPVRFR